MPDTNKSFLLGVMACLLGLLQIKNESKGDGSLFDKHHFMILAFLFVLSAFVILHVVESKMKATESPAIVSKFNHVFGVLGVVLLVYIIDLIMGILFLLIWMIWLVWEMYTLYQQVNTDAGMSEHRSSDTSEATSRV